MYSYHTDDSLSTRRTVIDSVSRPCTLQSPSQRGSSENTNGLLKQDFLKGTNLSVPAVETLCVGGSVERAAVGNTGLQTPAERCRAGVVSIG